MIKTLVVGMLTVLVLSTAIVSAQKSGDAKKAQPQPSPSPERTRVRRVVTTEATTEKDPKENPIEPAPTPSQTPVEMSAPATGEEKPQNDSEAKPVEKTPEKTEPKPSSASDDSLDNLRGEVEAATGSERIKLQIKLADRLVADGNKSEALAELHRAGGSDVADPIGFYNLGNSFARLGETEGAVGAYRKAIEQRRGRYSKAYNNLGVVLMRTGRWDEASEAFLSALKIESFRYAEASYNLGRLYAARGDHDLAVREWRRALAVDPLHKSAAQAISGVSNDNRITVAAVTSTPSSPVRNKVEESRNTTVAVTPEAKPVTKSIPTMSSARPGKTLALDQMSFDSMQRARSAAERGNLTEAVEQFRRVISRQNGYFGPANLELSYALLSQKKYEEALPFLVQVSTREGARYPISYFHLGRLYELRGDLRLAETAFAQAVEAYGARNLQFLLDLSRVREKQWNYKGALEALEKYVAAMDQQGTKPSWSDERIAALRSKAQ